MTVQEMTDAIAKTLLWSKSGYEDEPNKSDWIKYGMGFMAEGIYYRLGLDETVMFDRMRELEAKK